MKASFKVRHLFVLGAAAAACCTYAGYDRLLGRGVVCEMASAVVFGCLAAGWIHHPDRRRPKAKHDPDKALEKVQPKLNSPLLFSAMAVFLAVFPFSVFLRAVGLGPGILFIVCFSYLWAGLKGEHTPHSIVALLLLGVFVWLWGEAGKPGLVVMPVDLPEGREDMEFTADGVANALQTELEHLGANEDRRTHGDTEASMVLTRELGTRSFPHNPWYKEGQHLVGLQAGHLVIGTAVEGLPLSGIYHVLRHLRGMQLLETQVLLGNDRSLTLALRRSNGPLPCTSEWVSRAILSDAELPGLPNDDGRAAVDRLWEATRQVREGIPNGRDSIGCRPGVFRRALNALDIMPLPTAEDERIANVTARGLEGDARLSTALHFAALQAMEHLSSVGLAVYYDNTSKYQSSFDFYKKSVPDLLREAHEAAPYIEGFARRELAIAFIRIGDFQSQLRNECVASDKSHQLSERAYRLAVAVYPGDLQVLARVGYGYLIRAKEREWAAQFCGRSGDSSDFLGKSVERLKEAVQAGERPEALRRHGLVRRDEMLGWAYANLAYALTVYHTGRNSPYGDPAIMAKKAVGSSHEEDLRALAANVYVRSRVAPPCATIRQELDKIEDPVSAGPALSLHNYLLIEEQLWATYDLAIKSCPNEFHTEPLRGSWHKFVFESLLALDYLQSGITNPDQVFAGLDNDSGRIDELRKNADISAAITLRRAILKEDSKAAETKSGVCSVREATGSPASAIARAQSLCAKIESIQCTPGSDWFRMASRAVNSSRDDPYLRANLCTVLLKSNKPAEALTAIQDAVRLNPGEPRLRYLLGFALAGSGHAEEAHDQYEYGRALDPAGWPGVLQYFEGKLAPCNPNPIGKVDALPVEEGGTVRESPSHRHNASRSKKHGLEKILER